MPTKEAPRFIPEQEKDITPKNGFLTELDGGAEELPMPDAFQGEIPKEKSLLPEGQSETEISQATLQELKPGVQIEIQHHRERNLIPEKPKKERLNWFRRQFEGKKREYRKRGELLIKKLEEKGVTLTEEDKRKLYSIPVIWTINAVVSTAIGLSVAGGSALSLTRHRDFSRLPLLLSYNLLIPGGIRLLSTIAFEQWRRIKFDDWSKIAAFLTGWGMPVEIAIMSKKSAKHRAVFKILLNEVKEHYFTNPLAYARNFYGKAHKMIKRK